MDKKTFEQLIKDGVVTAVGLMDNGEYTGDLEKIDDYAKDYVNQVGVIEIDNGEVKLTPEYKENHGPQHTYHLEWAPEGYDLDANSSTTIENNIILDEDGNTYEGPFTWKYETTLENLIVGGHYPYDEERFNADEWSDNYEAVSDCGEITFKMINTYNVATAGTFTFTIKIGDQILTQESQINIVVVEKFEVGDIVAYNTRLQKLIMVKPDNWSNDYDKEQSNVKQVGIYVVPHSHNVYGDGCGAITSGKYMVPTDPTTGSWNYTGVYKNWTPQGNISFHKTAAGITGFSTYSNLPTVCNTTGSEWLSLDERGEQFTASGALPSMQNNPNPPISFADGVKDTYGNDIDGYYSTKNMSLSSSLGRCMSPYAADGISKNEPFFSDIKETQTTGVATYAYNGLAQQNQILTNVDLSQYESDCSTAEFPAHTCCALYGVEGMEQDWYLPTVGELTYLTSRIGSVENSAIAKAYYALANSTGVDTTSGSQTFWAFSAMPYLSCQIATPNNYIYICSLYSRKIEPTYNHNKYIAVAFHKLDVTNLEYATAEDLV